MNNKHYNSVMRKLRLIRKWTDQASDPKRKAEFLRLFCRYSEDNRDVIQKIAAEQPRV